MTFQLQSDTVPTMNKNAHIQLTVDEEELFRIIIGASRMFSNQPVPRAVGGWIRDKLLGVQSDDIDIMLDQTTGEEFAREVSKLIGSGAPHVVKLNEAKSKHVETAKMTICVSSGKEFSIDFAMARDEVYADGESRVPTEVRRATPQEDAMRRDLTINSLFYNLHTKEVEDMTGRGLDDLESGLAVTPLAPLKTFSDDALRAWRVVRFAARFDLKLDPKIIEAIHDPVVWDRMFHVISKERIGIEMSKMMSGGNALKSLALLKSLGILDGMLNEAWKGSRFDGQVEPLDMIQNSSFHELTLWEHTLLVVKKVEWRRKDELTWAAVLHDLGKRFVGIQSPSKSCPGKTSYMGHAEASSEMAELLLQWLVLFPMVEPIRKLVAMHMEPHHMLEVKSPTIRRFVRRCAKARVPWGDVIHLATADALSKGFIEDNATKEIYTCMEKRVEEAEKEIDKAGRKTEPSVLNGHEIMEVLGCRPGPHMKEIVEFVESLVDDKPDVSKEEARVLVKNKFGSCNKIS